MCVCVEDPAKAHLYLASVQSSTWPFHGCSVCSLGSSPCLAPHLVQAVKMLDRDGRVWPRRDSGVSK